MKKKLNKKNERSLHFPLIPFEYNKKILSKSTDVRIYKDTILLTEGEFCDSITRSPIVYTSEEISKGATNWSSNYLNLDHSFEVQKRLGFVKNTYYKDKAVRGDLYIFPITQAAKDTIALIDADLVNWLSVEITTEDYWNNEDDKRYASNIEYIGAAICLYPADSKTRIKPQGPSPGNY
jgi:hypothetical protein